MYEIYSMIRPGHPRWALAASALLFLIALVVAAALIKHKTRTQIVPLENESRDYPAGRLRVRLPKSWQRIENDLDPGYVVGVCPSESAGELTLVFRGIPRPLGVPSIEGLEALRQGLGITTEEIESQHGQIGPLPGWTALFASTTAIAGQRRVHYLGRSAIAPDGQVLGIILMLPRKPRQADRQLLDDLSRYLTLLDLTVADKPRVIMGDAGIIFEPPADARFLVASDNLHHSLPRLRMVGGKGLSCWYLDVSRVPLIGSRTVSQLVEHYGLSFLQQASLPTPIETTTIDNREVAQASWEISSATGPSIMVWCARTDEHTGLLLIGRHETEAKRRLHSIGESIIAGASVDTYDTLLDIAESQDTARRCLRELSDETLSSKWMHVPDHTETYASHAPTLPMKSEVRTYQTSRDSDGLQWWEIEVTNVPLSPAVSLRAYVREKWSISDAGTGHREWYQKEVKGQKHMVYTEVRSPGKDQVLCELKLADDEPFEWQVDVDDTYNCEPVLLLAGAKVARDPLAASAIFTTTEAFIQRPSYWIMTPLGKQKLPNPESNQHGRAVRLIQDYDPSPITLYYNDTDTLQAVAFDNIFWQERTSSAGKRGRFPGTERSIP